jgi:hypothetical protein
MEEVERGVVTRELNQISSREQPLAMLQSEVENLLLGYTSTDSADLRARRWQNLSPTDQNNVASRLIQIPQVGWTISLPKLIGSGLSPETCEAVLDACAAYHETLPFSASERRWLTAACCKAELADGWSTRFLRDVVGLVMAQDANIVSNGQHQTVNGAELMTRQWDWIRGGGEYEGNSSYHDAAKLALQGIANLFEESSMYAALSEGRRI